MRDWSQIDTVYSELFESIYPQPEDEGHKAGTQKFIDWIMPELTQCKSVIDFGCGEGYLEEMLPDSIDYLGIAVGKDVEVANTKGRHVFDFDYNFIPDGLPHCDLGISRHSLEHSPFPIITLKLWMKLCDRFAIVLPHPDWYKYRGLNHFSVMNMDLALATFETVGLIPTKWHIERRVGHPDTFTTATTPHEIWFFLERRTDFKTDYPKLLEVIGL